MIEDLIIPEGFWKAFKKDIFPGRISSNLSRNYMKYKKTLVGKAYCESLISVYRTLLNFSFSYLMDLTLR
jgi:hypothetical protein